jgi:hypothetical protein
MTSPSDVVPVERIQAILNAAAQFKAAIREHCVVDGDRSETALDYVGYAVREALGVIKTEPIGDATGVR